MAAANFKQPVFRSKKYLDFVRFHPCCICQGSGPCDPHHFQSHGSGIMGGKVSDDRALPLCHQHHLEVHQHGRNQWDAWGKNPEKIIEILNQEWEHKTGERVGGK